MNEQKSLLTYLGEALDRYRVSRRKTTREQVSPKRPGRLRVLLPTTGNVLFTLLVVTGLLWASSVGALPLGAALTSSTSTGTIAYQGRLADADGNPLTDTYNMIFRLYAAASGGAPLWEEQWTGSNGVQVSDGLFNVMLGSLTPIPQSVITEHESLFLGITVDTDDEMEPRVQLGSVPFAVQALTVPDGSVTTAKIADEAVTQAKLGADVSLEPPDGSITTEKLADGAVKSRHAALTMKKASGTNSFDIAGTNTWRDVQSLSINISADECPVASTLVIDTWINTQRNADGCQTPAFRCVVDGTAEEEYLQHRTCGAAGDNEHDCNVSAHWVVDVPAGSHTVSIQFKDRGGGMWFKHRYLTVMIIAQ